MPIKYLYGAVAKFTAASASMIRSAFDWLRFCGGLLLKARPERLKSSSNEV